MLNEAQIKSGQVHISSPDLSLNNNPNNDFVAEALEALLNRIQVDIEVDSNLKGLKKGNILFVCTISVINLVKMTIFLLFSYILFEFMFSIIFLATVRHSSIISWCDV